MFNKISTAVKAGFRAYRSVQYSEKFNKWLSGIGESISGAIVDEDTVYNLGTVYSCINVIAQTVGSLPLKLYKRVKAGRETADSHYLYDILHNQPNPYMLPSNFKETLTAHILTWGNGYAEIERDVMGRPIYLWPIHAGRVTPHLIKGELFYDIYIAGGDVRRLAASQILHIPGLSFDGISGTTPIQKSRETFGQALAAQDYANRYFKNDANPGGVLTALGKLSDEAFKRLQKSIKQNHEGLRNKHRFMLLEEGLKWEAIGLSPEDSQLLETMKFSGTQICGMFRVPPHKVGILDRATFSNIEAQAIEFHTDCVYPWTKKWEEAINLRLVMGAERNTFYAEFVSDGYLRGDIAARTAYYTAGLQNGWLSQNDVRKKENMNPIENGDVYRVQLNLSPVQGAKLNGPKDI